MRREKTRLVLSLTWQALYLITSSAISQKRPCGASLPITYCSLEFPTRRGKNDYVPRKYINMIQSPHPSKISTRKPNQVGMHLGCISLQTPPLLSIAYCVECSIMIIISSLHSKCSSSFASISLPLNPSSHHGFMSSRSSLQP